MPLRAWVSLSLCLLATACPGQRRPAPELRSASPTRAPSALATPTPSGTPLSVAERVTNWLSQADALLKSAKTLTPKDLPRLQALSDQGGLLGEAALEAGQDALYDRLEQPLTRLGELRARLIEASPKAGQ